MRRPKSNVLHDLWLMSSKGRIGSVQEPRGERRILGLQHIGRSFEPLPWLASCVAEPGYAVYTVQHGMNLTEVQHSAIRAAQVPPYWRRCPFRNPQVARTSKHLLLTS